MRYALSALVLLMPLQMLREISRAEPPKPTSWNIDKIASKVVWLGEVEASGETAATEWPRCTQDAG